MQRLYGSVQGSRASGSTDGFTGGSAITQDRACCSKVYLVFGLQVTVVSAIGLYLMFVKDIREHMKDANVVAFWVPMWVIMLVTMIVLHSYYDETPQNIYAQFVYLLAWGFPLAVVSCGYYPGSGVLIIPGVMCLGVGFIMLSALARWTLNWGYHALAITLLSSIPFQLICWNNVDEFEGSGMPPPAVTFILCNLFMVLVETYLVWKTEQSLDTHGTDQIWTTTADLLLASFGLPCIFPCQVLVLKLGWNCCGSRYLEGKGRGEDV